MIKVSVLYPNGQGARFDHEYYRDRHVPLVAARLATALKSYSIDKGARRCEPRKFGTVRCNDSHGLRINGGIPE